MEDGRLKRQLQRCSAGPFRKSDSRSVIAAPHCSSRNTRASPGILGVFSDWAAPVTYYANCMGLNWRMRKNVYDPVSPRAPRGVR